MLSLKHSNYHAGWVRHAECKDFRYETLGGPLFWGFGNQMLPVSDCLDGPDGWFVSDWDTGISCTYRWHEYKLKSGRISKRSAWYTHMPYCVLYRCQKCGRFGSSFRIQFVFRYIGTGLNSATEKVEDFIDGYFCTSCRNKMRPMFKAAKEFRDTKRTINKLKKEIRDEQQRKH